MGKKKVFNYIFKSQTVASGTLSIVFFTLISKLLGLVREMVLAAKFGTNWRLDAIIVAMDPAIQIGGIISTAVATMMVPIYIEIKQKNNQEKLKEYTTQILFLSFVALSIFGLVLIAFPDFFSKLFAPNFDQITREYTIRKIRITGIIPMIYGFNLLVSAIFKAERQFLLFSSVQLVYNIIFIPVVFLFSSTMGESSYLLAYILGTVSMNLIFIYMVKKKLAKKHICFKFDNLKVKETFKLSLPLMFSTSLGVIYNIIDRAFASGLEAGSISAMRYAQTITGMITTIITSSLMTTIFTELSETARRNDIEAIQSRMKKSSNDLVNFSLPFTMWVILMAEFLIKTLFQRGMFDENSTKMATGIFLGYMISFPIAQLYNLVSQLFLATKRTNQLLIISIASVFLNVLFNYLFIKPFGVMGLAISTSVIFTLQFILIMILKKKDLKFEIFDKKNILRSLLFSVPLFCILLVSKMYMYEKLWCIVVNISLLILFYYFNKKLIIRLFNSLKDKIKTLNNKEE